MRASVPSRGLRVNREVGRMAFRIEWVPFFHFSPLSGLRALDPQAPRRMRASQPGWIYLAPATEAGLSWAWCGYDDPHKPFAQRKWGALYLVLLLSWAPVQWRDPARVGVRWQDALAGELPAIACRIRASTDFEVRVSYPVACWPADLPGRAWAMSLWARLARLDSACGPSAGREPSGRGPAEDRVVERPTLGGDPR